jgi:hypothetical protein
MAQPFKPEVPTAGTVTDDNRATSLTTKRILAAAAAAFIAVLLLGAEWRPTPDPRMDLLETTTQVAPIRHVALAGPPGARPDVTVKAVLPGCRSLVATQGISRSSEAAFCNGMIDALLYLGELLPGDYCYAVPLDIARGRVVKAIVDEVEQAYTSVKEQHFRGLALEVLHDKWPCRDVRG